MVHGRVKGLALAQSADIRARIQREGIRLITGTARFCDDTPGPRRAPRRRDRRWTATESLLDAEVVLIATGATPRVLPGAVPDGERILDWRQLYDLPELPEHLVVVGSGVTGAEFASAYTEMGVKVTLISSRDRVLPHEDADAAAVLEEVFAERGTTVIKHARAGRRRAHRRRASSPPAGGQVLEASHALMTVGSVPNTKDLGLDKDRHRDRPRRLHHRRPRVAHRRSRRLRRRRLHRRADARLGRGHAGPHRDVARAGRGRRRRSG